MARALMFQGTGSSVGKSVLVAGIARALSRRGLKVRPFKPQNMSNNAAVTSDGGEIGRAQAIQAQACFVMPSVNMNPVLLKPQSEVGSQVIVRGKIWQNVKARAYQDVKKQLMPEVLSAFKALAEDADIVLVEGAGSASEVNLRENDIANMGFAEAADLNVVLIGDIDRGGVIASLVGTKHVLTEGDQSRIKGFIVNKMRGDTSLFVDGMFFIQKQTGWHNLGLVPYARVVERLPAEDAEDLKITRKEKAEVRIALPHMPMIANFDDLDPLKGLDHVAIDVVRPGEVIPECDLIILPGSKSTIADCLFMKEQGWGVDIQAHVRRKKPVLGICGGYQMLGKTIEDWEGIEGEPRGVDGLGLLNVTTHLTSEKSLQPVFGKILPENVDVSGYEMHVGRTTGPDCERPFSQIGERNEGAVSENGLVWGTYLHGVFSENQARKALMDRLSVSVFETASYQKTVEDALDEWADHLEKHLDIDALLALASPIA
ncbi:cobyric acid synthase [Swingsia samuiensis]|uniref:Cobyric acid synthase n=1 Tax=Swingsia samuiensis TaxID=1293412 RepID=A0A4Y6ULU9_9PROT|nr:cobyric acid synthase [Swingsia samuiensis]QDH17760.1 cobyric acid synthase [Swingsia samuiensis]